MNHHHIHRYINHNDRRSATNTKVLLPRKQYRDTFREYFYGRLTLLTLFKLKMEGIYLPPPGVGSVLPKDRAEVESLAETYDTPSAKFTSNDCGGLCVACESCCELILVR